MIVNSYPYNPSQQQQQRCVGLNQTASASESATTASSKPTTTNQSQEASMNNRLLNLSSISQQNSLYGSSFDHTAATTTVGQQQQQQQGAQFLHDLHFDSPMNPIDAQIMGGQDLSSSRMKAPQRSAANHISQSSHQSQDNSQATTATSAVSATANNDMSLYSPSSSTSLLYHIYDQINDQQYDANNNNGIGKHTTLNNQNKTNKNNNATILNPANLFGSQQQQQLPLQVQMQMHHQHQHQHQHQLSQLAEMQKQQQQQQCYSTYQQHPFSTLNPHHTSNSHHQTASYMTLAQQQQQLQLQQNNLMLDTVMRHQRLQRPLSSSAASSMSGQSIPAYGRHPRQSFMTNLGTNGAGFATTTAASSKSQNNLANVLHANQTTLGHLNHPHLIFGSNNSPLTPPIGGKKHPSKMGPTSCFDCNHFSKQLNQRARHLFYEYRTIVKCSLLLIVLAFALLTVIKFTLLSASVSTPTSSSTQASQQQIITPPFLISSSTSTSANLNNPSSNIFYPPPYQHSNQKPDSLSGTLLGITEPAATTDEPNHDMLKSRLLTGEFVILSQNFSRNPSQRSILSERIVKLMDQVFLSSPDVKQLYSRMEVTGTRPNQLGGGIIVNCNIILSESIPSAAQQFGLALYNSLGASQELLAGQAGYLIDKNSIKLNSVPDKDLKSGMVPAALIPPSLIQELVGPLQPQQPLATRAPSSGQPIDHSQESQQQHGGNQFLIDNLEQTANQVVWSEWSDWSSCVNKNGVCDSARLHSRLRRCLAQHTGDKVDPIQCKQRYSMQDEELELSDCSRTCSSSAGQAQLTAPVEAHITLSDEPSQLGPHTAPPFLVDSRPFMSLKPPQMMSPTSSASKSDPKDLTGSGNLDEPTTSAASVMAPTQASISIGGEQQQQQQQQQKPTSEHSTVSSNSQDVAPSSTPTLIMLQQQQPTCSNCTSDEICLLLIQQKVPFCAKVKDRTDSCGGWCKGQNQLCQPIGSSAFKCIHDSECLPEEWRCHDSQCIPLSAHCDGHSNCYDNSDERDCPIKK